MAQVERICPNCGKSNLSNQTHCVQCGIDLIHLSAPRQAGVAARADQARAAALLVGASMLIARAGLHLIARGILPRLAGGLVRSKNNPLGQRPGDDQPDWILHGWRAWSIHSGDAHSNGSEQFEWRIKRTKDR